MSYFLTTPLTDAENILWQQFRRLVAVYYASATECAGAIEQCSELFACLSVCPMPIGLKRWVLGI